jgi:hypothetical protein
MCRFPSRVIPPLGRAAMQTLFTHVSSLVRSTQDLLHAILLHFRLIETLALVRRYFSSSVAKMKIPKIRLFREYDFIPLLPR